MIMKQMEENEKEKVYKEEVREQENAAMYDYMQKLQEKDWEDFSKRKDSQKKLAVRSLDSSTFSLSLVSSSSKIFSKPIERSTNNVPYANSRIVWLI